jgi:hypothetical protein
VPLGSWVHSQPALVDVLLRTALYGAALALVLLMEKAFESRHEHDGFGPAMLAVFQHREVPHVWANTIGLTGALLMFNGLSVLRKHLGASGLSRVFLSRPTSGANP